MIYFRLCICESIMSCLFLSYINIIMSWEYIISNHHSVYHKRETKKNCHFNHDAINLSSSQRQSDVEPSRITGHSRARDRRKEVVDEDVLDLAAQSVRLGYIARCEDCGSPVGRVRVGQIAPRNNGQRDARVDIRGWLTGTMLPNLVDINK